MAQLYNFLWVIFAAICLLFIPLLLSFCYAVYKDPITPALIRRFWSQTIEKSTGYLGKGKKGVTNKVK